MKFQLIITTPHTGTYVKTYYFNKETTIVYVSEFIGEVLDNGVSAMTIENPDGNIGILTIPREVLTQSVILVKELPDET